MRDILKIEDLPAGVSEIAGEDLDVVGGYGGVIVVMKPGTGKLSTALNNDGTTDTVPWSS